MSEEVKPWHLLDVSNYTTNDIADSRYSICTKCELFTSITKRCTDCGCFMVAKTKLKQASCPKDKW